MNKLKLFIENFIVYGIGGVISKIIPLIMLPIVAYLLPDSSFVGLSDNTTTVISFASAIAVMGMYDAMYRMFFDKEDSVFKQQVCSTTLFFTLGTSILVTILMIVFRNPISLLFFKSKSYYYLVYIAAIATLVGSTNSIISAPTRMQNKKKIFLITNTISPIVSYSVSIPLILNGLYVVALPIAAMISGITMEITFYCLNKEWFSLKRFNKKLLKPMLAIAIPLLPNFLIYWVFNSCDKLMITQIMGLDAQGVYAISSKLGSMSQLIYTAFAGGWQYFAFATMNEKNQVKTNSNVFEYLGAISYFVTAFVCAFSSLIFKLFFKPEYYIGYIAAPYLFLAPLLLMLFQVACNQFIVVKKTWPNVFILSFGAVMNVFLNFVLIPKIGIEGASIATLTGYIVTNIIVVIVLKKMKLMVVTFRMIFSAIMMLLYFVVWRLFISDNTILGVVFALAFSMIIFIEYSSEIKLLLTQLKKRKG